MHKKILTIFFFSGISALIYQITWQRLLTVYYGVGSVSITLIVSLYMLGLGLGALLGGKLAENSKNPIGFYFWIELGIGLFGLLSFPLILAIGRMTAGSPFILAACYEFLVLLIPTVLMGMSLPVAIKIFSRLNPDILKSVSHLYCVNTLGGVVGALFGSYILISFYGIDYAIYFAAGINLLLAVGIQAIGKSKTIDLQGQEALPMPTVAGPIARYAPALVLITGFMAIGYELIWFRIIAALVKSSPYAFASVLSVYLFGIALGSYLISKIINKLSIDQRVKLFFVLQVLIGVSVAAIFIAYYYLTLNTNFSFWTNLSFSQGLHPAIYLLFNEYHPKTFFELFVHLFRMGAVFIWPAFFLLIPTTLMGASFPLIMGIVFKQRDGAAWITGKIYFFNVLGNALGGLVTGMVLMPILGSELTALVFVLVGLFFAIPLLMEKKSRFGYLGFAVIVFAVVWFFPKRGELYRVIHPSYAGFKQYFTEGRDGVVMTYVNDDGTVYNYINGDSHGGRPAYSFYVQVIEAAAAAKKMDNVLVIGYGTGSITEAVLKFKNVKKVTVIELNRAVIKNLRQIPLFQNLMNDPRLEFVVDDGRRFLQSHTDRYDLIFTSPLRATTAYSNNIYSQQFFALVSKRLDKDGIFVVWSDSLDVTFRTLDAVFSYKRLYKGNSGGFYMAANERLKTERDVKTLMTMMESLGARNEQNMIEASKGVQIIPQEVLRAVIYNYLPVQDWRPFSEYYLGIWFAEHWRKQVPKDAGAKK